MIRARVVEEYGLDAMDRSNIMNDVVASTGVLVPDDTSSHLSAPGRSIGRLAGSVS